MTKIGSQDLFGDMVALVTPMEEGGEINYQQFSELIKWHITVGTQAIVVAGTTGESALLSDKEFSLLTQLTVKLCKGKDILVIVGTGGISPNQVNQKNQLAAKFGADAVLIVSPYYIRISQNALINHYTFLADASPLPVVMYNVPTRTGVDVSSATTITLSKHQNIIGIKEAKNDMKRIKKLAKIDDFAVLSGDDDSFLEAMKSGAQGVISVVANVRPIAINKICNFISLGDIIAAEKIDHELLSTYNLLSVDPNPVPVKWLMHQAKMISKGIRKPLEYMRPPTLAWKNELNNIIKEFSTK